MAAPLIGAGIALVRLGPAIMRVAKKELGNWLKQGAKEIKKPTLNQKKESIVPSQLGKEVTKPKRHRDYYSPNVGDVKRKLNPKKDIKMTDRFAGYSHGGSTKRGKQRGMGKALRGGGVVTRS